MIGSDGESNSGALKGAESFFSMVTGQPDIATKQEPVEVNGMHEDDREGGDTGSEETKAADTKKDAAHTDLSAEAGDGMPHEARRVLVYLMRQGVVLAAQHSKLFETLVRYEAMIRQHLSHVYLQLVLDPLTGVAFVATHDADHGEWTGAENEPEESVDSDNEGSEASLITRRTLTVFDTLILLVLRKHYQERESAGEQKIIVDLERLESYLTPFLPLTDHGSKDRKKLVARLREMVRRKILTTVRGSEDRYEITPVIRYVVNAEFLETLLAEYLRLSGLSNDESDQEVFEEAVAR